MLTKLKDAWLEQPRGDYLLALCGLFFIMRGMPSADQLAFMGVLGGVAGALLGLTGVLMGFYNTRHDDALDTFTRVHGKTINRNWGSILLGFAIACAMTLLSIAIPIQWAARLVIGYALALTIACTLRLAWFLRTYFSLSVPATAEERDKLNW